MFPGNHLSESGELSDELVLHVIDLSAGGVRFRCDGVVVPGGRAVIRMSGSSGTPGLVGLRVVYAGDPIDGAVIAGACFTPLSPEVVRSLLLAQEVGSLKRRARRVSA